MIKPIFNNPANYIADHNYGKHYMTGLEVFKNNKIFGVGLKNYRIEVKNWKYDKASPETGRNITVLDASIHPHQIHFEILSELGITGYISFVFFLFFILQNTLRMKKILTFIGLVSYSFVQVYYLCCHREVFSPHMVLQYFG